MDIWRLITSRIANPFLFLKNKFRAAVSRKETFSFEALPKNLAELQAMPEAVLDDPFKTAALSLCALCVYAEDREAGTEMLQHALLYHNKKWSYSLSGLLSCLSDGLTRDNWNWVRAMWDFVLDKGEISAYSGAVAVFSQSMLERELDAYLEERFTSSWHLHCLLLGSGAPLNAIVPLSEVLTLPENTPLVVLNSRFLSSEERAVLQQHKGELLCIDPEERSAVELNDPPFFTGALPEPVPSSEQIAAWVQQICAMAPNVPQPAETGHRVFEETLTSGEKLLSVFNDQLYCRYVTVKMPMPFDQLQPIINHITPPFTTADTFMVHLPSFGVVALKVFPKN